jgi:purine-nucleoside phosphorylase
MFGDQSLVEQGGECLLERLQKKGLPEPRLAVVLGSGLGGACPDLEGVLEVSCAEVPGWPAGGVPGHEGKLRFGSRGGVGLAVQMGRLHYYEGLEMEEVTFPVRLLAALGVRSIFMSNAAGALNPAYDRGVLMLVRDHINLMGVNPLRGVRNAEGEPAFLDLSNLYDMETGDRLMERAQLSRWPLAEGVLVAVSGPSYETGAELRFMRLVGGDAVSMSLVPETLVAHFLGMSVTAVSVITNIWDLRRPHAISHHDVLKTAGEASTVLKEVVTAWVDLLAGGGRAG